MDLESHLAQLIAQNKCNKCSTTCEQQVVGPKRRRKRKMKPAQTLDRMRRRAGKGGRSIVNEFPFVNGARASLIGLRWPTRLTIILIGTCLLFSLFFALDFIIAKLASLLAAAQSEPPFAGEGNYSIGYLVAGRNPSFNWSPPPTNETAWNNERSLLEQCHIGDHRDAPIAPPATGSDIEQFSASKLGLNFDLIYENELEVSRDGRHYNVPAGAQQRKHPIQAELKLSRILRAYHLAMPFDPDIWLLSEPEHQMHLFSGNLERCSRELEALQSLVDGLDALAESPLASPGAQNYRLMQLLDAFGRPEAGTLTGHPFWLGSYTECIQVGQAADEGRPLMLSSLGEQRPLETRYCVGKVTLGSWPPEQEVSASIKVGLCLPRSCDSLALFNRRQWLSNDSMRPVDEVREQVRRLMLYNFNQQLYPASRVSLRDIYCLPLDESRQLSVTAFFVLHFLSGWLITCLLCSWLRRAGRHSSLAGLLGARFIETMALDANLERFVRGGSKRVAQEPAVVNLNVLDSVKHLGCIGVIAAHVLLTYLTLGTSYSHVIEHIGKDLRTMLLLSLNNVVDTFFVISGLLVAYLTFKQLDERESRKEKEVAGTRGAPFGWLRAYGRVVLSRYVRMAPLYFLVYGWTKSMASHLNSGPLWDYATNKDSLRGACQRESWLWPLAFLSDLKPLTEHCVPPAWSIAVNLQFFLLMPVFVAVFRCSQRAGYWLLATLVAGSTVYSLIDYRSLLDYVSLEDFAKLRLHVFTVLIRYVAHAYSQPQNRMGPILVGLVGGHMLYRYERRQRLAAAEAAAPGSHPARPVKPAWPRWMRDGWFRASLALSLAFMVAPMLVQVRERARASLLAGAQLCAGRGWFAEAVRCWWRGPLHYLLALGSSTRFDCYLALGGFVLIKPLWSICNCLLFLRLATDLNGTFAGRLMSLGCWRTLAKLNYAILLVHFEFIAFEAMSQLALSPITWTYLASKFAFAYLGSLVLALGLYVLIEQPMQRLTSGWLLHRSGSAAK